MTMWPNHEGCIAAERSGASKYTHNWNHALHPTRPSLRLQSWRPVGRVAELGPFAAGQVIRRRRLTES